MRTIKRAIEPDGDSRSFATRGTLTIVLLTVLAYLPVWFNGFVWDDDALLNPLIKSPGALKTIWLSTRLPDYFPMTSTSLWVEWHCWGNNPAGYHVTNVLLHALSAVLLWRVLRLLQIPGAWLAAAIFAVHPVNVESVAWLAERKNTLAMGFYLLTLWSGVRGELAREKPDVSAAWRWYGLSLFLFALALLSKTAVVPLPAVLLLCAWWRHRKITGADWLRALPFFGLSLMAGLVTAWFQSHRVIAAEIVHADGPVARLAGAAWAVWFYVYKALLPLGLCFVYPRWNVDPHLALAWLPLLALALAFFWLWHYRTGWSRPVLFAAGYYLLMLLPILGFLDIYFFKYSLVTDHWQYFSIPGLIALLVAGATRLVSGGQRPAARAAAGLLVLTLAALTWRQAENYVTPEMLWRDTLSKNPGCLMARNNLGLVLEKQHKTAEAEALYKSVLQSNPHDVGALNNLGNLLADKGRYAEAVDLYHTALHAGPRDPITLYNLGKAFIFWGRSDDAISNLTLSAQISSNHLVNLNKDATKLLAEQPIIETIGRDMASLRANPADATTENDLGVVLSKFGQGTAAIQHFRSATQLAPDRADFWNNLGFALLQADRLDGSVAAYRAALNLNPAFFDALVNLGNALAEQGQFDAAAEQFEAALKLKPDDAGVHSDLGLMFTKLGRRTEAVEQFQQALQIRPDYTPARRQLEALGE